MTVIGIGVDVVHMPRIMSLMQRRTPARLASRILSKAEMENWAGMSSLEPAAQARYLSVRWCLKEAAYKAVYPDAHPTWKEFSVLRCAGSKPTIFYHPDDGSSRRWKFHCSVSHDGDYVFGTVLVESI